MEKSKNTKEISLSLFWKVLRRRWIFLLLALIVGAGGAFGYSKFFVTPTYSSSATFLVTNNIPSLSAISASYQSGAERFAENYVYMIKGSVFSVRTAEEYSARTGKTMSGGAIRGKVSAQHITDTATFTVTVSSTDPKEALSILEVYQDLIPSLTMEMISSEVADYVKIAPITTGVLDSVPDSPNIPRNTLLGGGALFLLTYAIFFLAALLDDTVYHGETLEDSLQLPVIGYIPTWIRLGDNAKVLAQNKKALRKELKKGRAIERDVSGRLLDQHTPFSIAEAFKSLRTNLIYVGEASDKKSPVFGIVSDFSGAGKSLIAANIAVGFSQLGKRVLLIDGDMRCPILHRTFGFPLRRSGLSEALAGISKDPLTDCVRPTQYAGLDLMSCGRISPNSSELLSSEHMSALLEAAKEKYDYIFIDLPPICAASDAGVLAAVLTGYVLVARMGYSNMSALMDSVDILRTVNARIVGVVMNDIDMHSGSRYYGTHGRYSRYYGSSEGAVPLGVLPEKREPEAEKPQETQAKTDGERKNTETAQNQEQ